MNVNKSILVGRVTRDPELKALPSGSKVVSFSLATNRTWKNSEGAKQEETDFHNLVAFGKVAEVIAQYVKKGQLIYVDGRMKTRSWEDTEGKKNYRTEVIIENFQFGPKPTGSSAPVDDGSSNEYPGDDEGDADDIPF